MLMRGFTAAVGRQGGMLFVTGGGVQGGAGRKMVGVSGNGGCGDVGWTSSFTSPQPSSPDMITTLVDVAHASAKVRSGMMAS